MSETNGFLPSDYEAPKGNENYMKLVDGENKFRILSKPIVGWLDWKDKKPLRFQMKDKPQVPIDPKKAIKHFWAFIVWDYKSSSIKVLEITQSGIQKAIINLSNDSDWGSPFKYDIKISKKGQAMETEYTTSPVPHKKVSIDIVDAFNNKPIDLTKLYLGEDPFSNVTNRTEISK